MRFATKSFDMRLASIDLNTADVERTISLDAAADTHYWSGVIIRLTN